jgi:hypothetical protein
LLSGFRALIVAVLVSRINMIRRPILQLQVAVLHLLPGEVL